MGLFIAISEIFILVNSRIKCFVLHSVTGVNIMPVLRPGCSETPNNCDKMVVVNTLQDSELALGVYGVVFHLAT
jgi:hypothetical protein